MSSPFSSRWRSTQRRGEGDRDTDAELHQRFLADRRRPEGDARCEQDEPEVEALVDAGDRRRRSPGTRGRTRSPPAARTRRSPRPCWCRTGSRRRPVNHRTKFVLRRSTSSGGVVPSSHAGRELSPVLVVVGGVAHPFVGVDEREVADVRRHELGHDAEHQPAADPRLVRAVLRHVPRRGDGEEHAGYRNGHDADVHDAELRADHGQHEQADPGDQPRRRRRESLGSPEADSLSIVGGCWIVVGGRVADLGEASVVQRPVNGRRADTMPLPFVDGRAGSIGCRVVRARSTGRHARS